MTFYEAALRVLESVGKPLHFLEITQRSIEQNLLSHVGKTPEQTMLSRLSAMARRPRDRKVIVTGKDTFALADWALPEDPEALAQMAIPGPNPEATLPSLRPNERHPDSRQENIRVAGRGAERRRWREDEDIVQRKRRPAIPDVVFNILGESPGPLAPEDILERARSQAAVHEGLSKEQMLTALLEDNQRRIDAGRRPQFVLNPQTGEISLERAGAPSEAAPIELQAAFAQALGISLEGGRPVIPGAPAAAEAPEETGSIAALRITAREARRAVARSLKQRLAELDLGTFDKCVVRMLHGLGFREAKVAKRSRDSLLVTYRRRDGVTELRYAARLIRGGGSVDRKDVQELRRELGHYSAQVGVIISPAEARGDARAEAQAGGGVVLLWCGDALGHKFLEAEAGVSVAHLELFEIDPSFFELARIDAAEARRRREERLRERGAKPPEEGGAQIPGENPPAQPPVSEQMAEGSPEGGDSLDTYSSAAVPDESAADDELEESGDAPEARAGAARPTTARPLPERQRRRRRRGRRPRGPRPPGPPQPREVGAQANPPAEAPPPSNPAASEGNDSGSSGSQA